MKQKDILNFRQRIIVVITYLILFICICVYFSDGWSFLTVSGDKYNLLFVSSALLLIFGTYIAEPYFTKPVDVITNTTAIILTLLSINDPASFLGYWFIFYSSTIIGLLSILLIFLKNNTKIEKINHIVLEMVVTLGQSKVLFSFIYLLTTISYFQFSGNQFFIFLGFWIAFIFRFLEYFILWITKKWNFLFQQNNNFEMIGEAIGCDNPFLYIVEIDFSKHKLYETKKGDLVFLLIHDSLASIGIIVNEKQLLNRKWLTVYLLEKNNEPIKVDPKTFSGNKMYKSIFSVENAVSRLDINNIDNLDIKKTIETNYLYKNRDNFIGYVFKGSNINQVNFYSLLDQKNPKYQKLKEGAVIKTQIYEQDVLYQIIDGKTDKEELDKHDSFGYMIGVSRKLGEYDLSNFEINPVKWLPNIYAPIFFIENIKTSYNKLSIGKLPETNYQIILKDINTLVTHNTAILGILGVGKSRLAFELISKIIENTDTKIICIDITNEYKKELINYIDSQMIKFDEENAFSEINGSYSHIHEERDANGNITKNHLKSGNQSEYRASINKDLKNFFFNLDEIPENHKFDYEKRIRIFNPDYHKASKGEKVGFNVITADLSQAEKTRVISEEIFRIMMKVGLKEDNDAKVLIVFEEAHSLVPEWSSTAYEEDKSAVNGTAKVILQGRKYGLGSLIITQRTANISKSILNQCNTIFALRVFDDTGKQFLENYIGSDYSNTLATLQERYSIVVGRALKLKQPVIIELNDMNDVMLHK